MATIKIPARLVPYLQSAAVYTLGEEAGRVRDGEAAVRGAEDGQETKLKLAKEDLANVRPFLDRMIPLAQRILALPADKDAVLDDEPELAYYVLHNMASRIIGPQIAAELDYLPMPPGVPAMAEALSWASAESIRLEEERAEAVRREREGEAA